MDVLTKHRACVTVSAAHGRACERHKGSVRQSIAQMLRIARLVLHRVFGRRKLGGHGRRVSLARGQRFVGWLAVFQLRLKAILRAVRLIGNHHNVATARQHRKHILVLTRHELLNRGKDDAAGWPVV